MMLKYIIPIGYKLTIDVPEPNKKAMEIANKYGMTVMFKTIWMYSREEPDINLEKVYGVTTFELW